MVLAAAVASPAVAAVSVAAGPVVGGKTQTYYNMSEISRFSSRLDNSRIEKSITEAENQTSGEIRVVLQAGKVDDPVQRAEKEFARLKMQETAERNGVLFFVAPDAHKFAVFGDQGIHEKCPENFWEEIAAAMEQHFRADDPTQALVEGITRAGSLLAAEFPRQNDDRDELSNEVVNRPADG
ncbi:MAG: TPM domain-containing protein [Synoicihabitans sp.]